MTLRIAQETAQIDESRWRWSVWLDACGEELDAVRQVLWKLHPSFSPSQVQVSARSNSFRLDGSGWGEFEIQASVFCFDGTKQLLSHWLRFEFASDNNTNSNGAVAPFVPKGPVEVARRKPTIFLSYTIQDARLAGAITEQLKREYDVKVVVDVDIPPGEDLSRWVYEKITESDAVVVLVPKTALSSSRYADYEVGLARAAGLKIIPVIRDQTKVPDNFVEQQCLYISVDGSLEMEAQAIAKQISEIVV
ncbi:pYEATS domain-containing protein [Rhodopseudomonas palustris]